MINYIAQAFGIIGAALAICSFQFKKNNGLYVMQGVSGLCFAVNYLLIASYPAAFMNFVNLFRSFVLAKGKDNKKSNIAFMLLFCVIYTACSVIPMVLNKFDFISVMIAVAQLVGTVCMFSKNGKVIRLGQLSFVSPVWLIHNIINFTLGGIICEVFNMASICVSIKRFGINGFEKPTEQ